MADINAFAMVNGVYVDDDDRRLAHEYITGVLRFLADFERADRPEYHDMTMSSVMFPDDFGPNLQHLSESAKGNELLRSELRRRIRRVMGEPTKGTGEIYEI
jgi:hypothetical protein